MICIKGIYKVSKENACPACRNKDSIMIYNYREDTGSLVLQCLLCHKKYERTLAEIMEVSDILVVPGTQSECSERVSVDENLTSGRGPD